MFVARTRRQTRRVRHHASLREKALPTHRMLGLESLEERVLLSASSRNLQAIQRLDPLPSLCAGNEQDLLFVEQAKLTASDGAAGDQLGGSIAVSGNTMVVGGAVRHGRRQQRPGRGLRIHGVRFRLGRDRHAHRVRWRGRRSFRLLGFDQRQYGGGRRVGGLRVHRVWLHLDADCRAHAVRCGLWV